MIRHCDRCERRYDDAVAFTFCPHDRFLSDEAAARKDHACKLLGVELSWASEPDGEPVFIESVTHDGMVSIAGHVGVFAPHLFRPVTHG